jgi:hypothetical protein
MRRANDIMATVQHMPGHIPRQTFVVLEKIGEGAFGNVHKGALFLDGTNALVAVKELKVCVQGRRFGFP